MGDLALFGVLGVPALAALALGILPGYHLQARLNVLATLLSFLSALTFLTSRPEPGSFILVDDFNLYLKDDGIPDVLEARTKAGELNKPAKERYHKHVKALVQVGSARSELYATPMGYPAELIPTVNPYTLQKGATLRVKTLVDGKPAANQYVLYGGELANGAGGIEQKSTRSDAQGIANIPLTTAGVWYVKFINMTKVAKDSVDYESKWATLTFEVR